MSYADNYDREEGVAIIGMSGRFPGAADVAALWRNLAAGRDCISRFTEDELEPGGPEEMAARAQPQYVKARGVLADADLFDAAFFGMPPREAEVTDPQQRLFLEAAWTALESAGYDPHRFAGAISVFAGMTNNSYFLSNIYGNPEVIGRAGALVTMMGNEKDYLATRTSYKLNLRGLSVNVQTACSTSLVAVCQAFHSLVTFQSDMALAGGVSVTLPQKRGYLYHEGAIVSPDGYCRAFDEQANGTVFSHGLGVVVLKRIKDALADGDHIHAVIKGAALNNDGSSKVSFTAPSVDGQAEAIALAQATAGIDPETISYVETHGTGTALGDPVEIAALTQAFRAGTSARQFCAIGSLKSAIGHLDAAAGVAGLIKTVLALEHAELPPSLHFVRPNPKLNLEESPFFVNTALRAWTPPPGVPRRAGVSSFGVGGTNAHAVLEEAPRPPARESVEQSQLLLLSARTAAALEQATSNLHDHLKENADQELGDVAFTMQAGRHRFAHRRALVCRNREEALEILASRDPRRLVGASGERGQPQVAFMFPGQGAQAVNMGRPLYDRFAVFRAEIDACAEVLRPELGRDLREILYPPPGDAAKAEAARLVGQTMFTQPALFAVEHALAQTWLHFGVTPAALIGHSVGEYVAACLAGMWSRDDALRLLARRARMMQDVPAGSMMAVGLPIEEVTGLLPDGLAIAASNGPTLTVVSGPTPAVTAFEQALTAREVPCRPLHTSHAFHSSMMDAVVTPFARLVAEVPCQPPRIPWVSTMTGEWITGAEVMKPDYWTRQLREPVLFMKAAQRLLDEPQRVMLEVGPRQTLATLVRRFPGRKPEQVAIGSLHADGTSELDGDSVLAAAGQLWLAGLELSWPALHEGESPRRVPLPTYPFERKRFWVEPRHEARAALTAVATAVAPAAAESSDSTLEAGRDAPYAPAVDDGIRGRLRVLFSELSGIPVADLDPTASFLELGLDSLFLTQASTAVHKAFRVRITFRELLEELPSLDALGARLEALAPAPAAAPPAPAVRPTPLTAPAPPAPAAPAAPAAHAPRPAAFGPYRPLETTRSTGLTGEQAGRLATFIERYNARTAGSKRLTAAHRAHLADPRTVAGFRASWKEMVYPLVVERSAGSRLWDVDGNEYVDMTNGFGMILFGHSPRFITEALKDQLDRGVEIGPQTPLAGEVAELLSRMTGMERVAFCNTGSEAVTAAVRVARTVSGRDKIVVFQGAYHGIFDEVLVRPTVVDGRLRSVPIAPGILPAMVDNVIVLDYGSPEALNIIAAEAGNLAAVLVEPVLSRRPDLVPVQFLHQLRAITAAADVALVFDEVVTGFRTHPGGAQARFDVRADLATYGKVLGGGMPIGVVAGSSTYMDALDGGAWEYGDNSFPSVGMTFFAGTFVRHPLALAAARAVLHHLEAHGPSLQADLDLRTKEFVRELQLRADRLGAPIHLPNFSSWFCVQLPPELPFAPLFFAYMREQGIHLWEGRPAFLTTAHTDEDLERVASAFELSLRQMQENAFLGAPPPVAGALSASAAPLPSSANALPLTAAQQEMWAAVQMEPGASCSYNQCFPLRLRGPLDVAALSRALDLVVARHAGLRATFSADGNRQAIQPALSLPLPMTDLASSDASLRAQALADVFHAENTTAFDLERGPLVRARLVREEPECHVLVLTAHHLVCDGWSSGILLRDLGALYTAEAAAEPPSLPAPVPYQEYIDAHAAGAESPEELADVEHWLGKLDGTLPTLELPLDHPRPARRTFRGGQETMVLEPPLTAELRRTGARRGCTLYVTLLAAYQTLLHRLTGQQDLVVGIPVAGQALLEEGDLVGHCVNTLPVRVSIDPAAPFAQQLRRTRETLLEAHEHQRITFGSLLPRLTLHRDPSRQPLVSTTFNVDRLAAPPRFAGLTVESVSPGKEHVSFELAFNIADDGARLTVECLYASDLFTAETARRWLGHYRVLLEAVVADADRPVQELPLLTPEERHRLLFAWNPRERFSAEPPLHRRFEAQARRTPDAVAVCFEDERLTYAELNQRANHLAHRLRALGVDRNVPVGLCLDRSLELVVSIVGILKAGGGYVPIDPAYPAERRAFILADAQTPVLVTDRARAADLPAFGGTVLLIDDPTAVTNGRSADDVRDLDAPSSPEDLAYIIYTSGSTGRPKGVEICHRHVVRLFEATSRWYNFGEQDVWTLFHSAAFDVSVWELWGALLYGGRLVVVPYWVSRAPDAFLALLAQEQVTVLNQTPSAFQQLMEADRAAGPALVLRLLIFAGEALDLAALRPWVERHGDARPQLVNMYGITETTVHVTYRPITARDIETGVGSVIGVPIPDLQVYLLDAQREPVPFGIVGEIYVGGAGVARGYLRRPDLNSERFLPDPFDEAPGARLYRSGDLARRNADGELVYLGRIDHQIKIRGFRIELGEIESVLATHPALAQALVIQVDDPAAGKRLVAYVVPRDAAATPPSGAELRQHLGGKLPDYMVPASFVALERFPLTTNGKIDRRALPAPDVASLGEAREVVAPRTETEAEVVRLFAKVVGRPTVSVLDSFFELGGHSMLAVQLLAKLRAAFSVDVQLRSLFERPTVAGIAEVIDGLQWHQQELTAAAGAGREEIEL